MAVRYIVVPRRVAPAARHVVALPAPAGLGRALDSQIDLRPVESDDSLLVYENAAWLPGRALLTTPAARQAAGRGAAGVEQAELGGSPEALAKTTGTFSYQGPVSGGDRVYLAESADARWRLSASGSHAARADAFGWANQFRVSRAGTARLRYHTALTRYMAIVVEAVLWLFALRHVMVARRLDVQGGSEQ
jgi:hypothetical protein